MDVGDFASGLAVFLFLIFILLSALTVMNMLTFYERFTSEQGKGEIFDGNLVTGKRSYERSARKKAKKNGKGKDKGKKCKKDTKFEKK